MIKIGITGGIGSGKSTVCRIFSLLGTAVYDSDTQARRLMNDDPDVRRAICGLFGDRAYNGGRLDRREVASRVFADGSLLERLNAMVHPAVAQDFLQWAARQQGHYVIQEAAILFESGAWRQMDAVVAVTASEEVRIRRVCGRDGVDETAVRIRMAAQISEQERVTRAGYVIRADDSELVIPQVLRLHEIFNSL